jgi:cystathionine beta-lyase/cystathionine gamma-synthase
MYFGTHRTAATRGARPTPRCTATPPSRSHPSPTCSTSSKDAGPATRTPAPPLNRTIRATEVKLTSLEGGQDALALSAGMAAEAATRLAHTRPGQQIVCLGDVYGGMFELLGATLP